MERLVAGAATPPVYGPNTGKAGGKSQKMILLVIKHNPKVGHLMSILQSPEQDRTRAMHAFDGFGALTHASAAARPSPG